MHDRLRTAAWLRLPVFRRATTVFAVMALVLNSLLLAGCGTSAQPTTREVIKAGGALKVLAVETFLADIAQNVAGDRAQVTALMPLGVDPHAFEPAPADIRMVAESQVLIVNGAGFESFLQKLLSNAGGERQVIDASAGLTSRTPGPSEAAEVGASGQAEPDPHFWLDPVSVIRYVQNIRDGLSQADPSGSDIYTRNADTYIAQLNDLNTWIAAQVTQVPSARRLLVTNHETLGYFADRYGFKIVGAVIPSISSAASPSAQQLARLVDAIKATGAPAIFLETGANAQLAEQLSGEAGIKVVTGLYTHSVTAAGGDAPTYIEMMRYNVRKIVEALK